MKTTVERFSLLVDELGETVSVCSSSKLKGEIQPALKTALLSLSSMITHLKENEKRKYTKARKALSAVHNVMSGMYDGLAEGDLTIKEFRQANKQIVSKFLPMVTAGLMEEAQAQQAQEAQDPDSDEPIRDNPIPEETRAKIKISISKSSEMRDAVQVVSKSSSYGEVAESGDGMSELEKLAQSARASLPVRIPGDFKIVRVPIVPIFSHAALNRTETLKKLGFKHLMIEGFVVLQDQILLNVSKSRASKAKVEPLVMAHSVVDLLNDRGAIKYEIVSDTPNANPRNTDLLMFWILPRTRMAGMMKLLGSSKTPALVKWGLPLPAEKADLDKAKVERKKKADEKAEQARQAEIEKQAQEREALEEERRLAKELNKHRKAAAQKKELEEKRRRAAEQQQRLDKKLHILVKKNQELHGRSPGSAKK